MFIEKKTIVTLTLLTLFLGCLAVEPNCETIENRQVLKITGNKLVVEDTKVIQINKRMGDEYATIKIPYSKLTKVSIVNAQIENEQGTVIRKLKRSEIKDYSNISDFSLYEDDFIKEFELKHNIYPYRIRYTTETIWNDFQEIAHWYPCIDDEVPTRYASLELHTPMNYKIRYYTYKVSEPTKDTLNNTLVYKFEVKNISLPTREYYSPPIDRFMPFVRIVPYEFNWINKGTHADWKEYGNWIYSIYDGTDVLPEHEKIQVKKLTQGLTNKYDIIKVLYKYMQNKTRYINVSIGVGGLKPYPAEYVSKNGYGDCKALSVYMKALLKEAGITAYYATIYADDEIPMFLYDFPCHQSNHIMNCIPLDTDTIFLECTNSTIPMGYLGSSTQGREALLVGQNVSRIIRTPDFKPNDVKENRKFVFRICPENNTLTINNCFKGYNFDLFNSLHNGLDKTNAEVYLRERIIKGNFSFEILDWNLTKPHPDSAKINFYANLNLQNYLKNYGPDYGMPLPGTGIPIFEQPGSRKLPLHFGTPIFLNDTIIFHIESFYKIKQLLHNVNITSKYGEYVLKTNVLENNLMIYRSLLIRKGDYPITEYPDFYKFISEISKNDRKLILLSQNQ